MVRPNPALSGRAGGIKEDYRRKKGPGPPAQMPSQKVQAHPFEAFGMHTVRGEKNHIPLPAKQILANKDSPKNLCGCVWAGQQVYSRVLPPESWSYPLHRHDPSKGKPDGLPGPGFRKRARPCGQRKDHPIPAVVNAEMPFQYSYFRPAVYPDIDYLRTLWAGSPICTHFPLCTAPRSAHPGYLFLLVSAVRESSPRFVPIVFLQFHSIILSHSFIAYAVVTAGPGDDNMFFVVSI